MNIQRTVGLLITLAGVVPGQTLSEHVPGRHWVLSNGIIDAEFSFTDKNTFEFVSLRHVKSGDVWKGSESLISSPIRFATLRTAVDGFIPMRLISESTQQVDRRGLRLNLVLDELDGGFRIFLSLDIYDGQPVVRYNVRVKNMFDVERRVRMADMLRWSFEEPRNSFKMLKVNQWNVAPPLKNFEPRELSLLNDGTREYVHSGASQPECAWFAVRDANGRGLFAGWEFDGRAEASVRYVANENRLTISSQVQDLNRLLLPEAEFQVPSGFIGAFHGDWDEAGFRTQRFVESVLAKPTPDEAKFPYVVWDSWGYKTNINEETLRRNAEVAAKLGMELFIVDLGWARNIGDWREDPAKFPNGLRALSDYVHSLGMKFALHVAPAEVAESSPIVKEHPEWLSTEPNSYFGAKSLCLSHKPAQEWIVQRLVELIDEYNVDWILQDGEHMVKTCTRTDHTHDPEDSNYSNAVEGLNAVLDTVQKQRPRTLWENCANGGSMMTFNMVKYYVTSITNDASGALASRQAVYGATYPFPPRYTDRYMPENPTSTYNTRSYMFGGPWIFMNKLAEMSVPELELAASEIRAYKTVRVQLKDSKVYHLTAQPGEGQVDALEGYSAATDSAVVVVTRDGSPSAVHVLKVQGLTRGENYRVRFQDDRRIYMMTGEQLERDGVTMVFPSLKSAEIVYIEHNQSIEQDNP